MALEAHIRELSEKHSALDTLIQKEIRSLAIDDTQITALKRKKLKIKEELALLQHQH
ncbi:MAG: hypothetical protein FD163_407 [Hyphomonadaceae bacterium]|nr:MAG: hypothetical protein FD128_22 [Hyphomonadaceae bacterium]KAF0187132.1 MAG: hypothetical protein FD163_407 [Hyphomonadaceae bacterium]